VARAVAWLVQQQKTVTWLVLVVIVVAGAAYAAWLGSGLVYPDEREHVALARSLAQTGTFSYDGATPTAYRPPAYPAFLALLVAAGAPIVALRMANVVLLAVAAGLMATVVRRYAPAPAAPLAAAAVGLYPLAFYTAGTLYAQTFATALAAGCIALVAAAVDAANGRRTWALLAGAGVVGGVLVLAVSVLVVVPAVLALTLLFVLPRSRRAAVVALIALTALVPAGWVVRNAVVMDAPTLATNSGINLLLGNSANTGPNTGVNVDIREHLQATGWFDPTAPPAPGRMSEVQADAYYRDAALAWVTANPAEAAALYAAKVVNYFNFRNELYVEQEASAARDAIAAVSYYPLLLVVGVRLLLARRRPLRWPEVSAIGLYLGAALVMAVFFTRLRFRVPMDMVLCALAASYVGAAVHRAAAGGRGTVRPGAPGP